LLSGVLRKMPSVRESHSVTENSMFVWEGEGEGEGEGLASRRGGGQVS
jgi:hypothetical protein